MTKTAEAYEIPEEGVGSVDEFAPRNCISLIRTQSPKSVQKVYRLGAGGAEEKTSIANITRGTIETVKAETAEDFAAILVDVTERVDTAIVPGTWDGAEIGQPIKLVCEAELAQMMGRNVGDTSLGGVHHIGMDVVAARLSRSISESQWVLFDADSPPGMPEAWSALDIGERLELFEAVLPGISRVERIELRASSSRVDRGEGPGKASHAWIRFTDIERLSLLPIHCRVEMVVRDLSFQFNKRSSKDRSQIVGVEPRTLFDLAVWCKGRLVFCSRPSADIEGYSIHGADVQVINPGAGAYDNSWMEPPTSNALDVVRQKSGTDMQVTMRGGALSMEIVGVLQPHTLINLGSRNEDLKPFVEIAAGLSVGQKVRCQTPFRESYSMAAFIRKGPSGAAFLYDIGSQITYRLQRETQKPTGSTPPAIIGTLMALSDELGISMDELSRALDLDYRAIDKAVAGSGYDQGRGRFIVLESGGDLRVFNKDDAQKGLTRTFGPFYDFNKLEKLVDSHAEYLTKAKKAPRTEVTRFIRMGMTGIMQALQTHILVERQFYNITIRVDMFAEESSMTLDDGVARLVFSHIPFKAGYVAPRVLADYKEHWSQFDRFLDMVAASRFAASRKKSYLWLRAESDWGKGFLTELFKRLGLVVSMSATEIETVFSGKPVGRVLNDFKRAWILEFNEFKSAKSELKMLEQEMSFAPKGLPTVSVELFLKLFTSAEEVESLASHESGVEDQFANRFSLMSPKGNLDLREVFRENRSFYVECLTRYVAGYLNKKVAEYREMGRAKAAAHADETVSEFYTEFGIANTYTRLSVGIGDLCDQFLDWTLEKYKDAHIVAYGFNVKRGFSKTERSVFESCLVREEVRVVGGKAQSVEVLYAQNVYKLLSEWMEDSFNASARGKLAWKRQEFKKRLPEVETKKIDGKTRKVMMVGHLKDGDDVEQNRSWKKQDEPEDLF